MQYFELERGDVIPYAYHVPQRDGFTFVTFNALTQGHGAWDAVAARWHDAGHGSLRFDLCGQSGHEPTEGVRLDVARIVADSRQLIAHVQPPNIVFVGLSIGGLFAIQTVLEGTQARALVLINTLRRDGPRLAWINAAVLRAMQLGGPALVRDLYAPLLMGEPALRALVDESFPEHYEPVPENAAVLRLLRDCGNASWDVPYESLELPVLVVTGLRDRIFYEADVVNELILRLPDPHRVDLPDVGHLIPMEQPAAFADAVLDFVSGL